MKIEEILQLRQGEDQTAIINRLTMGRKKPQPDVAESVKALDPEQHDVYDEVKRPKKKVRVDAEDNTISNKDNIINVSGQSDEENGTFKYVDVERIALAIQQLIVKRAVAFLFGTPPTIDADPKEGTQEDAVLSSLERVLRVARVKTLNRQLARAVFEYTEAAELWYPEETEEADLYGFKSKYKLKCRLLTPKDGYTLYPYFDGNGKMVAFSHEYDVEDTDEAGKAKTHHYFETWTKDTHIRWERVDGTWQPSEGYPKKNPIGKIPVIYACQEATEFKIVQSLIDRLEVLLSNFADTNDYHASPKIFTTGSIMGWAKKGESGAVIQGEDGATAQYLSWAQAPESVKLEIETLLRMIHTISQTPDVSFDSVKGLNLSGTALKLLFMDAHLKVQDKAEIFEEHLQRRHSVIQAYLGQMNAADKEWVAACKTLITEPVIHPYMIEDDTTKVSTLMSATGQKPILTRRLAVQKLGYAKDVNAEVEELEAADEAAASFDITEPTM